MPYRILSLDGGGSWALLQAMALDKMFPGLGGREILSRFNLVAANSGGSIVLAALAADKSPAEIVDFFDNISDRQKIFVALPFYYQLNPLRIATGGPRYSAEAKLAGLRSILDPTGDIALKDLSVAIGAPNTNFLITAFNFDRLRATFFRSNMDSLAASPPPVVATLAEAVHASSNAPIRYFDAPAEIRAGAFWDGAMAGYNNPVLAACAEAMANRISPTDICALSIGTGTVSLPPADGIIPSPLAQPPRESSAMADLETAATTIVDDPPDSASFLTYLAIGHLPPPPAQFPFGNIRLVRMNPLIQGLNETGVWKLPPTIDADDFEILVKMDMDAVDDPSVERIKALGQAWITDQIHNQPIRASRDLNVEIGHRWFGDAWTQAKKLTLAP